LIIKSAFDTSTPPTHLIHEGVGFAFSVVLLHKKYSLNPPDGITRQDILHMSDSDLLDMDYFLNEEDSDDFGEEDFYIF